jgi:acyl-CoA thioester hydrolase
VSRLRRAALPQPFHWPVRVYYEDTDAAGAAYYASYLRYLERARTEWLAAMGVTVAALEREHKAVFVVNRLEIDYRLPARLYDALDATLTPVERGGARLVLVQDVLRGRDLIASARVSLACVNPLTWRPTRIPASLLAKMETYG